MSIWSLTLERVSQIEETLKTKNKELEQLKASTAQSLWIKDLQDFKKLFEPGFDNMSTQIELASKPLPIVDEKLT